MQRGHLLIVSVLCCLCAVGPLVVCVLMDEWYVVMSMTNSFKLGLTNMCIVPIQASDGATSSSSMTPAAKAVCGPTDYSLMAGYGANAANVTTHNGYEGRSTFTCSVQPDADAIQQRFLTIQGLVVAALAIGAVQGLLGIAVGAIRVYHWGPRLVLAVLAVASAGAGIAACVLYPLTMELWVFCGQRYCSAVGSPYTDCTNYLGYGYALLCCGAGLLALNVALTLVVTIRGWDEEVHYWEAVEAKRLAEKERQKIVVIMDDPWGAASKGVEVAADCTTPPDSEVQSSARRRYPNEPPLPLELQGGDWEYDPETGYFWSEESTLYFEPETQQFYDPQSDAWFNPETELWYKPLVPTEGDLVRPREPSTVTTSPSNGADHFSSKAIPSHRVESEKETVPFS